MKPFASRIIKRLMGFLVCLLVIPMFFFSPSSLAGIGIRLVIGLYLVITGIREAHKQQKSWYKRPRSLLDITWLLGALYTYLDFYISVPPLVRAVESAIFLLLTFACVIPAFFLRRRERAEEPQVHPTSFFSERGRYDGIDRPGEPLGRPATSFFSERDRY